ncbi:MAG: tyrosine-type recombinase/integrase [Nitrososphaeraceae archaeon]
MFQKKQVLITNNKSSQNNIKESKALTTFLETAKLGNRNTAIQYQSRLVAFDDFINQKYVINLDQLIEKLNHMELDPYDILNQYCIYLKNNSNILPSTFRDKIITTKTFLEYNDVEISPKKFKIKVRFPKTVLRNKEAIDKKDIIKILNGISDLRLRTYVLLLASTGLRATEALSIRIKDINMDSDNISKITIRGEYTKTKTDRFVFLTNEMADQIKTWLDYKYRKRRVCFKDRITGKNITENRKPNRKPNELIFSLNRNDKAKPETFYVNFASSFAKTLDRMGMGDREDGNETRREITLHSFRRFVKTTISDLGYSDYSEWFIGHSGSTYWRKKEGDKIAIFRKIEPYLTFLNIHNLERQGADLQTRVEELQIINQSLREKDKVKEDALALLSDKVMTLMKEVQNIKNK